MTSKVKISNWYYIESNNKMFFKIIFTNCSSTCCILITILQYKSSTILQYSVKELLLFVDKVDSALKRSARVSKHLRIHAKKQIIKLIIVQTNSSSYRFCTSFSVSIDSAMSTIDQSFSQTR